MKNKFLDYIKRNDSTIMTIAACVGVGVVAVTAAHDALKAKKVIEESPIGTDKREIVKKTIPCYIPTVLFVGTTITAIIEGHKISSSKIMAYASAYSVMAENVATYRDKAKELFGKDKAKELDDSVAEEHLKRHPASVSKDHISGVGDVLCYDDLMSRYFRSDMESIRAAVNDCNYELINGVDMWVSLNEFYDQLGLDPVKIGEDMGWDIDDKLNVSFSSRLSENGVPCLVMRFDGSPKSYSLRSR